MYQAIFFLNRDTILCHLSVLEDVFNQTSVIKPILTLFYLWGNIALEDNNDKVKDILNLYMPYLENYSKCYYDEYYYLFLALNNLYKKHFDYFEAKEYLSNTNLSWILLEARGNIEYDAKNYFQALSTYTELEQYYKSCFNPKRQRLVGSKIINMHNISKSYRYALDKARLYIQPSVFEIKDEIAIAIIEGYLYAAVFLDLKEDIYNYYLLEHFVNLSSFDILVLKYLAIDPIYRDRINKLNLKIWNQNFSAYSIKNFYQDTLKRKLKIK